MYSTIQQLNFGEIYFGDLICHRIWQITLFLLNAFALLNSLYLVYTHAV